MNDQILKAHALVAKKKLSMSDFEAFLLGLVAGNRRPNYYDYIQSPAWKRKADAAKKAAGYRCQVCNADKNLEAHHRTYKNLGDERPEDITVLCDNCHSLFHGK